MTQAEDPVTAEYDVFLTPSLQEQIYLLQYLNRPRERPYSDRFGARPENVRIKAKSGFLEMDVDMHTGHNFNRFQSLKWGDALQTAKGLQNDSATYGAAAGFGVPRSKPAGRGQLKDKVERENDIFNNMASFTAAQRDGKVLDSQTLGGKIISLDKTTEGAQPQYFIGAFRGQSLHLTKVDGTAQMRPQFHHVDAEEQRNRVAASRAVAAETDAARPPPAARALQQSYKDLNDDKDKDAPERKMRKLLQEAEEETWSTLHYVDEQEDLAFETFNRCMFLADPDNAKVLKATVDAEAYLNLVSIPPHATPNSPRKKTAVNKKQTSAVEIDDDDNGTDK